MHDGGSWEKLEGVWYEEAKMMDQPRETNDFEK
jgi:hypothetical protein